MTIDWISILVIS